jgi:signal transduction histidine kinase
MASPNSRFRLLRHFSLASAIAMALMTLSIVFVYQSHQSAVYLRTAEDQNVVLARSFANTIWSHYSEYLNSVGDLHGDVLLARPETAEINQALHQITSGLPVLKVKIFDLNGLTVYSSDYSQIGESRRDNPGFIKAVRSATPASKASYRGTFSAFSGIHANVHLAESYVPIVDKTGKVVSVFELYTDITPRVASMQEDTWYAAIFGVIASVMFYLLLLLVVGRADKILRRQYEAEAATAEMRAKAVELERSLKKEKELNQLQRQFVLMASHEFRTPLAIIDAAAQGLKRRVDRMPPEEAIERIDKIRDAVKRMVRLMESTLMAARMEEGKVSIEIETCDLGKTVREVCERQQDVVRTHNIGCRLVDLPRYIKADANALDQVLTNLLSNAVKYSPGAPEIDVVARGEGDEVVISVRDRGLGIDKDDLPRMFERFFRARNSSGIAGTGIGLNLSLTLVKMHGGSIEVDSRKGEGSTFTVRLPVDGPRQAAQSHSQAA